MTTEKLRKKYYLQLRADENVVRMVEYAGSEIMNGEKAILLVERTKNGIVLHAVAKSMFMINWRTWNRPPLLEWVRRPWP